MKGRVTTGLLSCHLKETNFVVFLYVLLYVRDFDRTGLFPLLSFPAHPLYTALMSRLFW